MSEELVANKDDTKESGHIPADDAAATEARKPEFSEVSETHVGPPNRSLSRFLDVEVTVSAELGRVTMPLGQLVELGEGSVVELNRSVAAPVDLMAQGRKIASGEVVVINDCFAIRIQSVDSEEPESE